MVLDFPTKDNSCFDAVIIYFKTMEPSSSKYFSEVFLHMGPNPFQYNNFEPNNFNKTFESVKNMLVKI